MAKAVQLRRRAVDDIEAATDHYLAEGGTMLADRFVDVLERALEPLAQHPQIGSLRYSYELDIPGLRSWPLRTFPYLVFYVDSAHHVDVWRLLHSRSDVPSWLAGPDDADPSEPTT